MAKKKVVVWAGDKENCGHCEAADKFFSTPEVKEVARTKYYHVDTAKGSRLLDAAKSESIPTMQICDTTPSGQKRNCHFIEGFDAKQLRRELGVT